MQMKQIEIDERKYALQEKKNTKTKKGRVSEMNSDQNNAKIGKSKNRKNIEKKEGASNKRQKLTEFRGDFSQFDLVDFSDEQITSLH